MVSTFKYNSTSFNPGENTFTVSINDDTRVKFDNPSVTNYIATTTANVAQAKQQGIQQDSKTLQTARELFANAGVSTTAKVGEQSTQTSTTPATVVYNSEKVTQTFSDKGNGGIGGVA